MLEGCLQHESSDQIAELAKRVKPSSDSETNYFSAAHRAYCGQEQAALEMLAAPSMAGIALVPRSILSLSLTAFEISQRFNQFDRPAPTAGATSLLAVIPNTDPTKAS